MDDVVEQTRKSPQRPATLLPAESVSLSLDGYLHPKPAKLDLCPETLLTTNMSMIRLLPTGLSLTEADIDFHLRLAEIHQGLRKQGFKKDDIVRYLNDYRAGMAQPASQGVQDFNLSLPSTVELSISRPDPSVAGSDSDQTDPNRQESAHSSSTNSLIAPFPDLPSDLLEEAANRKTQDTDDNDAFSPISTPPHMLLNQHAPRKSSLLRFAQVASPESLPADQEDGQSTSAVEATPRVRKYKRRSSTYPYQSSERESTSESNAQDDVLDGMNQMSLEDEIPDDELEAFSFLPPSIGTPSTPTNSATDSQFASPATGNGSGDSATTTFVRPTLRPRRSSSLLGRPYSSEYLPSSPPFPRTPARQYSRQTEPSSESPQLPITPTPIRNAIAAPRTEPRAYRHQLDGNSFSVYNDSLPAGSQPQTPADLSRQPFIAGHDASYTAPPGMIRPAANRHAWDRDSGEQSPTARAITLRERRNRELTRSIRAEGVRLNRMRIRDEAMLTQRAFQTVAAANGGVPAGALPQVLDDVWRDDLDADRVGEENFEADPELAGRRVMRAVSGNARFDL